MPASTVEPPQEANPLQPGHERTGLAEGGYQVTYGTSFLMVTEMTPEGPEGVGLLAYGQSGDPASPHHVDGTRAYAAGQTRPLRFRDDQIDADPTLPILSQPTSGGCRGAPEPRASRSWFWTP